ncbi:PLP-dependent aminotransferase family protein [Terrihabitans rhizophilus]|uniref:PLP-dependent aminotransferase family protein n=1 Tax=Terrihabitans rhizophilus TaxID=3092662 RepID=A0ABU4RJL4_9HYPH|nr:PLP-dependent aminotransferase family protein [Terrihabitans sp. PJ23]MDX6804746.1 PLP-dependent aminotransferase family protein [Terrihabitans sp. PJ23]
MLEPFFNPPLDHGRALQQQIQERLVEAILAGAISSYEPLPATRGFAARLGVSRNTVSLVYERLAEDGYLTPVNRRGYFINERYIREQLNIRVDARSARVLPKASGAVDYAGRFVEVPSRQLNIVKPENWRDHPFPFVYGQVSPDPTSVSRWRDCVRQAGSVRHAQAWMGDLVDIDDAMLVDQIIRRMLPKRGFRARPDEILITIGAQNALFLIATLLCGKGTRVGIEEPGYVDARNIFGARGAELRVQYVDTNGIRVGDALEGCALVYVTPSHQSPTSVTMSMQRRLALLEAAQRHDFLIVEDDYEHELNFVGAGHPALKSFDEAGRVLHIGSLSKPVFPGLRLGFVVAPPEIVRELRASRRLMYRHPSALDQRAMAIFLADGHFDAHIRRQRDLLSRKWKTILREIERVLPDCSPTMTTGGSAVWLRLPEGVDETALQAEALARGVVVEPGGVHFLNPAARNHIRLGFAAIAVDRIPRGIELLADALSAVRHQA